MASSRYSACAPKSSRERRRPTSVVSRGEREPPYLVVDLGGGSSELGLGGDGIDAPSTQVQAAFSMDIGSVRMTERHLRHDPPSETEIAEAIADIDEHIDEAFRTVPAGRTRTIIGVSGTVTTMSALALGLKEYDHRRVDGVRIPVDDAYAVDEAPNTKGGVDKRTVLHLDPRLAPVKAAVLPLSKKPDLQSVAQKLAADLRQNEWMIDYDEAGAIGRRYRREDEIGTPLCVTVDFDTLDDQAVTIRERDTMQQERVSLDKVADYIAERIGEKRVSVPQMPVEMGGEAWPESVKIAEAGGLY